MPNSNSISSSVPLVFAAAAISLGCNVCEDLDQRLCTDLGAADCKAWKAIGQTFTERAEQGGGRNSLMRSLIFGKGSSTCQSAGNDAVYPKMLEAARALVTAKRAAEEK